MIYSGVKPLELYTLEVFCYRVSACVLASISGDHEGVEKSSSNIMRAARFLKFLFSFKVS